jgi:hypothetical protein
VSHTAESVFQMAFEEIYSSDASTWHLQFHGNANPTLACQDVDVFLSNGVESAPATLYALSANIAAASRVAAAGGPVLVVDVYDAPGDCGLRGTDNMQMRFASGLPHASIWAQGNVPVGAFAVHSRGATPRRAARAGRPFGHARAEPRRCRGWDPDYVSLRGDSFSTKSRGSEETEVRPRFQVSIIGSAHETEVYVQRIGSQVVAVGEDSRDGELLSRQG